MRISIFGNNTEPTWEVRELVRAAQQRGHEAIVHQIISFADFKRALPTLGSVVVWRSTGLESLEERAAALQALKGKLVINAGRADHVLLGDKLYQYETLQGEGDIPCVPTFHFASRRDVVRAFEEGILSLPIVQKVRVGRRGEGVDLLTSAQALQEGQEDVRGFIYQPFIPNQGDFRVIMLGGVMLGAIRRSARDGEWRNNVALGGSVEVVLDPVLLERLRKIGEKVAVCHELALFGLDLILDEQTDTLYVLEINTVSQWKAFQQATGIVVADKVVQWIEHMVERDNQSLPQLVGAYYQTYADQLRVESQFHFWSRLALWSGDQYAYAKLAGLQSHMIGSNAEEMRAALQRQLALYSEARIRNMLFSEVRKPVLMRYPHLMKYIRGMFYMLFADVVYGKDTREVFLEEISTGELLEYRAQLLARPHDVARLSTHAVNFLYLVDHYFLPEGESFFDPKFLLDMADRDYDFSQREEVTLCIYLLTHSIIGESKFYSRFIVQHREVYIRMCRFVEKLIQQHYFSISLDVKHEFLVCCRMLGIVSELEPMIRQEGEQSLFSAGNFMVDTMNGARISQKRHFTSAEHSNLLFLLTHTPWKQAAAWNVAAAVDQKRQQAVSFSAEHDIV